MVLPGKRFSRQSIQAYFPSIFFPGMQRAAFSAKTTINRKDYGLNWNVALETGGVLVSEKVTLKSTSRQYSQHLSRKLFGLRPPEPRAYSKFPIYYRRETQRYALL